MEKTHSILYFLILLTITFLASCNGTDSNGKPMGSIQKEEISLTGTDSPSQPDNPTTNTTLAPTIANRTIPAEPLQSITPSITAAPTQTVDLNTVTPSLVSIQPGKVNIPVLLYHHIADELTGRYYVPVDDFREQMNTLHKMGYKTITISKMADIIRHGGQIPEKPIVITFDDGALDVYENAFPIMQDYGFVGCFYIVANRLNADGFVGFDELTEMVDKGWEIGSHSFSHIDLTLNHAAARHEIFDSRMKIGEHLGIEIESLAYPFGMIDPYIVEKTFDYGYSNAVGLGKSWTHNAASIYYIKRIEIRNSYTIGFFKSILPDTN